MKTATERDYKARMLRVLIHIQRHLDEALDLEVLAGVAHFSPYHFHRIFRGMVGESVMAHVRRLRLERAAYRLAFTGESVAGIAFGAGYEAHEAFTRAFRASFGCSPSQYRGARREVPLPRRRTEPAVSPGVHFDPDGKVDDFAPAVSEPREVRVERLAPRRVAFMRHVGPYDQVGPTWGRLMGWAMTHRLPIDSSPIALVHDDPEVTPPDRVRYDACVTIGSDFASEGEVGVQEIPGGEYAVLTHVGPYERIGGCYAYVCGLWGPPSGRELRASPAFEVYRNSPRDTNPEDLRTDVHVPLEEPL